MTINLDSEPCVLGRAAATLTSHLARTPCQNFLCQNMAREDFGTMRIGYARVSTTDQNPELQIDALLKAGVERRHLYEDHMTGLRADRPKLAEAGETPARSYPAQHRTFKLLSVLDYSMETLAFGSPKGASYRYTTSSPLPLRGTGPTARTLQRSRTRAKASAER